MKIFISWSGKKSRAFAELLKPWLEQVLPGTDVWLSSEDIDKGTIWFSEIIDELKQCNCGIVCITRDNYLAPWIHFEAGGMISGLGKARIATLLLDIGFGELQQPLSQFNGLRPDREGLYHLVKSFNKLSDRPIKEHVLDKTFEKFWPELEATIRRLFPSTNDAPVTPEPPPTMPQPLKFAPRPRGVEAIKGSTSSKRSRSKKSASGNEGQSKLFGNGDK
jgi:TIR domain-containing protein